MKVLWRRINDDSGFTLIELLLILAVLGIIAANAVPRLPGSRTGLKIPR